MPITRVPIVHKFGIISQSQREELQERLLQQSYLQSVKTQRIPPTTRNPLELSESFVQQFNGTTSLDEKEKLEAIAHKMLNRTKRRAGILEGGKGKNVDLPKAWTDLSMLAQCRGKIQEECLDLLIVSLNQAPLVTIHIPSLFYLAETTLYWLRTDAMDQPFLRIGEIKLLKMGQGVFLRLYYHHMAGHLKGYREYKNRLITYLAGVRECEEAYSPYPGAHLCLRFISEVGRLVVEDVLNEDPAVPGAAPQTATQARPKSADGGARTASRPEPNSVSEFDNISGRHPDQILEEDEDDLPSPTPTPKLERSLPDTPLPSGMGSIVKPRTQTGQSSIHDLSPTLWHSLDVWRCVVHLSGGFREAVRALSMCGSTLATEHWVDALCALRVIAETARSDLKVLKTLQNLARGVLPSTTPLPPSPLIPSEDVELQDNKEEETGEKVEEGELESIVSGLSQTSLMSDLHLADHGRAGGLAKKLAPESDFVADGKHLSDLSGGSLLKSARNTSTCVLMDTPKQAELLTSPSSLGQKASSRGGSTPSTALNVSSARESLNSAGDLPLPSGLDDPSGSIEDSDLDPGDDSEVEANDVDVTRPQVSMPLETGQGLPEIGVKLRREVSFDVEPTDRDGDLEGDLPKKSSLRDGSGRSEGTRKSNSAKSVTIDPVPDTQYFSEASGSTSNKQAAQTTAVAGLKNKHPLETQGLAGWPWEVSFAYAELMSHLCLHGSTAEIQRTALVGSKKKGYGPYMHKKQAGSGSSQAPADEEQHCLSSAGLLDLAEYQGKIDGDETDESSQWGWRIRYSAILGLVKVTRCTSAEKLQEGMRTVAWNALMRCHSMERDHRVLEAFRVGQVEAHIETQMQKALITRSFNSRLAGGLAAAYLPPLAPPVEVSKKSPRRQVEMPKPKQPVRTGPNRLSLKQELLLATALDEQPVDFKTRTDLDLKRIVEDQWRKELQQQLEEEEKAKEKALQEDQETEESRQKERSDAKARKLNKGGAVSPPRPKTPSVVSC
ncbi:transmembrane protein 232-like isoform X2 [Acanthaster planci]|uniref:Transmembrane protein 232-like isoform X2 n=1 Tax=Acanthaster planci TaxID=133434 RepID=A0A8B7YC11_ACAPL|nr:transmembrane protein 232-like isoform X2 [Acanthaster planci]